MVGKLDVHNRETTVQVRTYSLFIGYMIDFICLECVGNHVGLS